MEHHHNQEHSSRLVAEPEQRQSRLQIGVSFSNLICYGSSPFSQHQKTFSDYAFAVPYFISTLFRREPQSKVQILQGINGLVLPGDMLLVLGRPGSGCSTFLKTLAGDTRGFQVNEEAIINYNGITYDKFHSQFKGERIYLAETDVHFPELRLGETLQFAHSTRHRNQDPDAGRSAASLFSLDKAIDTPIGNEMTRGVSGGEKRRTSIAEAFISGAQLQCWDNSTRGLDSSTARNFIQMLREATTRNQSSVAMSLYQASEKMYQAFDKIMLLYEGRQIYYGAADEAADYFVQLGFKKTSLETTADFLTSLTSPAERVTLPGYQDRVPRTPDEFAAIWNKSSQAKLINQKIEFFNASHPVVNEPPPKETDGNAYTEALGLRTSTYPIPLHLQALVCVQRAFLRLRRNVTADVSAIVANAILGLIIGSVFYDLSNTSDSLQPRSVLLFFALMVNGFVPAFEVLIMWAQRPIVEKHHRYAFYHPSTERLASIISDFPIKVAVSVGIHIPLYFLSNLRRNGRAFMVYWLFMFVNLLTMSMLFRMIGTLSRKREQIFTPVSVMTVLCIIYTGFIVPPDSMVPWLAWFWRLNPLAYTYESLMLNEMRDRLFPCSSMIPSGPQYDHLSATFQICAGAGSKPGQPYIQGSEYLSEQYGFVSSHTWRNLGILVGMTLAMGLIHLAAAQYVPAVASRGEILLFRRSSKRTVVKINDEENGIADDHQKELVAMQNATGVGVSSSDKAVTISSQAGLFHWENLNYRIGDRMILQNVDGWVKPGTLTALMGATGAGKTSLLDALADRTTAGHVDGDVFVNNRKRGPGFRGKVAYVQQTDVHLATSTVREALQFSALLRQPATKPKADKLAYVETVLDMMDMRGYAEAVIGVPGEGLNIEQRRRLTIAVELVAQAELLLFLDEPTSGLDSQTAWSICMLLRKLADHGQTILYNGSPLYFGALGYEASTLINYFESNGARGFVSGENPAEWMLEIASGPPDKESQGGNEHNDWSEIWQSSPQKHETLRELAELRSGVSGTITSSEGKDEGREFAASFSQQVIVVCKRIFQDQWRSPTYLYSKVTLSVCLALAIGISFYNATLDYTGVVGLLFSIFLITSLFSTIDQLVIAYLDTRRGLFEARERNSKMYSWVVFIASNLIVELLWQTVISVPVFAAWYYPTGLQRNGDATLGTMERGALSWVLIWLFTLWASTLSQAFAVGIEHGEVAMQMATLFYWLTLVFCGILVSPETLRRFWIFMYRVSPLTYLLEGLAVAGLAHTEVTCSVKGSLQIPLPADSAGTSCGDYLAAFAESAGGVVLNPSSYSDCRYCTVSSVDAILASFGMSPQHTWRNVGILVVYVFFNILMTFGIYWLARVPKKRSTRS